MRKENKQETRSDNDVLFPSVQKCQYAVPREQHLMGGCRAPSTSTCVLDDPLQLPFPPIFLSGVRAMRPQWEHMEFSLLLSNIMAYIQSCS